MSFKIVKTKNSYQVIGPYKDNKKHIYGTYRTKKEAERHQNKLKFAVDELSTNDLSFETKINDIIPKSPTGIVGSKEYARFKPSLFKLPMNDKRHEERRLLDFDDFLDVIGYKTHDGQSDKTTQMGRGMNIRESLDPKLERMAREGKALKDGSFPINSKEDLEKAIKTYKSASDIKQVKRHIIKRATELGYKSLIPKDWI